MTSFNHSYSTVGMFPLKLLKLIQGYCIYKELNEQRLVSCLDFAQSET